MNPDGDLDGAAAASPTDLLDDLIEQGRARPPLVSRADFTGILPCRTSTVSTAEIIRDVRGRW